MSAWRYQGLQQDEVAVRLNGGERVPLFIMGHHCTGDHIICAGMYRVLAQLWQINVLVRPGMHETLCLLLQGIKDAKTVEMPESMMCQYCDGIRNAVVLRFGFNAGIPFDQWKFDKEFYRHAGVPFNHRWDSFVAPEIEQLEKPNGDYVFIHDRPELNGAKIKQDGFRPNAKYHIFAHREIILGAKALHCVSSSFAAFADSFDLNGKDLNFYPFKREIPQHRNKWKIWK